MEGDSISTAVKTDFCFKSDSSNRAKSTRYDPVKTRNAKRNKIFPWEHLDNVKIPSKTWDNVVSRTRSSPNENDLNPSDDHTTMSRQGEE